MPRTAFDGGSVWPPKVELAIAGQGVARVVDGDHNAPGGGEFSLRRRVHLFVHKHHIGGALPLRSPHADWARFRSEPSPIVPMTASPKTSAACSRRPEATKSARVHIRKIGAPGVRATS